MAYIRRKDEYKERVNIHFAQQNSGTLVYATYRLFYPILRVDTSLEYGGKNSLVLPSKIDALFEEGWERHPVILQLEDSRTVVFLMNGGIYIRKEEDSLLLQYAREHAFLEGRTQGLRIF